MRSRVLILLSFVLFVMVAIIATLWSRRERSPKLGEQQPPTLSGLDYNHPATLPALADPEQPSLDPDTIAARLTERVRTYHQVHGKFPSVERFWKELDIEPIPNSMGPDCTSVVGIENGRTDDVGRRRE